MGVMRRSTTSGRQIGGREPAPPRGGGGPGIRRGRASNVGRYPDPGAEPLRHPGCSVRTGGTTARKARHERVSPCRAGADRQRQRERRSGSHTRFDADRPPNIASVISFTTASPMPDPFPGGLVVNPRSKFGEMLGGDSLSNCHGCENQTVACTVERDRHRRSSRPARRPPRANQIVSTDTAPRVTVEVQRVTRSATATRLRVCVRAAFEGDARIGSRGRRRACHAAAAPKGRSWTTQILGGCSMPSETWASPRAERSETPRRGHPGGAPNRIQCRDRVAQGYRQRITHLMRDDAGLAGELQSASAGLAGDAPRPRRPQ